jgi:hypothetical protein
MAVKHWNTGPAAMRVRYNLELKKKRKKSTKHQAPSAKQQAASLNMNTIK